MNFLISLAEVDQESLIEAENVRHTLMLYIKVWRKQQLMLPWGNFLPGHSGLKGTMSHVLYITYRRRWPKPMLNIGPQIHGHGCPQWNSVTRLMKLKINPLGTIPHLTYQTYATWVKDQKKVISIIELQHSFFFCSTCKGKVAHTQAENVSPGSWLISQLLDLNNSRWCWSPGDKRLFWLKQAGTRPAEFRGVMCLPNT